MNNTFDRLVAQDAAHTEHMHQQLETLSNLKERKNVPMKISEMTTANFADFIETAGDSIANIIQNEAVAALFTAEEKRHPLRWMIDAGKVLLGPCKDDTFTVIGAMYGKTAEEIGQQSIHTTLGMLRSIYEDVKSADVPE